MKNVERMFEGRRGAGCEFAHETVRENQIKQLHLIEYRMATFFIVFVFISFMRMPNALSNYRTNKLALFRGKREIQ